MATRRHSLLAANRRNMGLFEEAYSKTQEFEDPVVQRRKAFKHILDTGKEIYGGWKKVQSTAGKHLDKKAQKMGFENWEEFKEYKTTPEVRHSTDFTDFDAGAFAPQISDEVKQTTVDMGYGDDPDSAWRAYQAYQAKADDIPFEDFEGVEKDSIERGTYTNSTVMGSYGGTKSGYMSSFTDGVNVSSINTYVKFVTKPYQKPTYNMQYKN